MQPDYDPFGEPVRRSHGRRGSQVLVRARPLALPLFWSLALLLLVARIVVERGGL